MNSKILFNSPDFEKPVPELEQYSTPPDIAFEIIKKLAKALIPTPPIPIKKT